MKKVLTLAVAMVAMFMFSNSVLAEEGAKKDAAKPKEWKHQTNCPVMGGKIDSSAFTDIQGQRVYHCCPACTEKLNNDPDKYFKQAEKDGIVFENIQADCPVCGMKLENKDISSHIEGRLLYFCSDSCSATFAKEPHKYLDKMLKKKDKSEEKAEKSDMHDMHKH